jgi:hypothetical protein
VLPKARVSYTTPPKPAGVTPNGVSGLVVGDEHDRQHERDDECKPYGDGDSQKKWRRRTVAFFDDVLEALHLGDGVMRESTRLFLDLLREEISSVRAVRKFIHVSCLTGR